MVFSHLDKRGNPKMVDVSEKMITWRTAKAECQVIMPIEVCEHLLSENWNTPKGPVFQTAIIAGVMAAKKTHEVIPFCHPLGLEKCDIQIHLEGSNKIVIHCLAGVHHKTGVEMEALTGASVAALTVYDMCKALSHDIKISGLRLLKKTGGKSVSKEDAAAK